MRWVRIHAWAFGAGVLCLAGANWVTGGPWWSFWPIALWSMALALHYFVCKARTVSETWAEERAADLHSKSYDAHHIDSIAGRHDGKTGKPPASP
ncbi:MAG: 2TM domain-containing protein [Pseudomonadota bacterium]